MRFIADENTQLVGLRSGDLDGVLRISANAAAQARTIPHVRVATSALNAYWGVMMNNRARARDRRRARAPRARVRDRRARRFATT